MAKRHAVSPLSADIIAAWRNEHHQQHGTTPRPRILAAAIERQPVTPGLRHAIASGTGGSSGHVRKTSTYRGVNWMGKRQRWRARIKIFCEPRQRELGTYANEDDAARAYNKAALAAYGELATLNDIPHIKEKT